MSVNDDCLELFSAETVFPQETYSYSNIWWYCTQRDKHLIIMTTFTFNITMVHIHNILRKQRQTLFLVKSYSV